MRTIENFSVFQKTASIDPEKLAMLKRVFDLTCLEASVPKEASAVRNALADRLINAAGMIDDESVFLIFARNVLVECKR